MGRFLFSEGNLYPVCDVGLWFDIKYDLLFFRNVSCRGVLLTIRITIRLRLAALNILPYWGIFLIMFTCFVVHNVPPDKSLLDVCKCGALIVLFYL